MKRLAAIIMVLGVAGVAAAHDLGNRAPVKPVVVVGENVPGPGRQDGDTIADAFDIPAIPFATTGTTSGYHDDYDEVCPYVDSTAPDVCYTITPNTDLHVSVDLCQSGYDTKVYVYDADLNLLACNDDYYFGPPCGTYVSRVVDVYLLFNVTYYIIIDGYGDASGSYALDISQFNSCVVPCPAGWHTREGEPPLVTDYVDNWNGGCNTDPGFPFQTVLASADGNAVFCGESGWYVGDDGPTRDTDWYLLIPGDQGSIEITADAESETYLFELGPQDCESVGVIQLATAGPCAEGTMTISGYATGAPVWFWVGPTTFLPTFGEYTYDYVLWISGLVPDPEPTAVPIAGVPPVNDGLGLGASPNPFNPRTTVSFALPQAGRADVAIYDSRGQLVARLVDDSLAAGEHAFDWNGRDAGGLSMPSGLYFCRLTTAWGVETRKLQLVR